MERKQITNFELFDIILNGDQEELSSLLKDEGDDGFRGIDISLADNKPGTKARTSSKDIQASSSQASDIIARATSEAEKIIQDAEAEADADAAAAQSSVVFLDSSFSSSSSSLSSSFLTWSSFVSFKS